MNILKIKELAENRAGGLKKLARDIDMSEANLHRCINANKIQANDLEKISSIFKVPIGYFFDDTPLHPITQQVKGDINATSVYGNANISSCQSELEAAKRELKLLREMLQEKERTIQILMSK